MPRARQPRQRAAPFKEKKKVCYVATEDSKTGAYKYFEEFSKCEEYNFLEKYAFKMTVLPSVDGASSPAHVLSNIKAIIKSLNHKGFKAGGDKFWIVCDVDRWGSININDVIEECDVLGVDVAFSNPCSEIWILYHQERFDNTNIFASSNDCKLAATTLLTRRGLYANLLTTQQIDYARGHAERAHSVKADKWPNTQGSHIYKLVDYLIGPDEY